MKKLKDIVFFIKSELQNFYEITEIESFTNIIFEHFYNFKRLDIYINSEKIIENVDFLKIEKIISELKNYKPIQYILGYTFFYNYKIFVNSNVLIPRPETEELIEWILKDFHKNEETLKIIDIGTGSGCIAITLVKNIINAELTSVDISEKALDLAQKNAVENNVKVDFKILDILNFHENETEILNNSKFDVIVSNPPYVRLSEKQMMQKNVTNYEPHLALFVEDKNPLIFYQKIRDFAVKFLNPNGAIYFEINENLGNETCNLFENISEFQEIELRKDINNKPRMLKIKRAGF